MSKNGSNSAENLVQGASSIPLFFFVIYSTNSEVIFSKIFERKQFLQSLHDEIHEMIK